MFGQFFPLVVLEICFLTSMMLLSEISAFFDISDLEVVSHQACQKCVGAKIGQTGIGRWSSASDTRPGRICLAPVRVIALVRFARRASQSDLLIDKEIEY